MWIWKWVPKILIYNPEEMLPGFYWVHDENDVTIHVFWVEKNSKNTRNVELLVDCYNQLSSEEAT